MFKKIIKGLLIFFVVLLIAIIALPFIFKDKIAQYAQTELDNALDAKIIIGDFDLSILKNYQNFPNITLSIEDLKVIGKGEFAKDTLADIGKLNLALDLMSVIKSEKPMKIHSIEIFQPKIRAIVSRSGKANWDITKPSKEASKEEPFSLSLKKLLIEGGDIEYSDYQGGQFAIIRGLEHKGNGDFTQDVFDYETVTNIDQLSFTQNKLTYLSKAKILFEGAISIMQKESKYTFKENNFKINDLGIKFDGWLMNKANNPMSMDIKFKADKTDFKSVLSLVPAIFAKDFDKIKTSGTFNLAGNAKGIYKENWYPAFNIDLIVNNGKFQYPSLPTAISNIEIETHLQNPGGSLDKLQVKIPKWNMLVGSDPVAMKLNVTTPISDPNIDLMAKGKMDLSKVKNFYPMDNVKTLTGLMNLDLDIKTKLSSVKNKQFDQVKAAGFMQIFGLNYASKDVAKPVQISALEMKFNPQFVELTKCAAKIGQSDFALTGRLDNVIGYMFAKGEVMKGNVHLASNFINANEFLSDSASAAKSAETKTLQNSDEYVKVPDNIDFTGSATINRILYDKINLTAVSGDIKAYDESVTLNATKANLLGGNVQVKGVYTTKNLDKPTGTLSYNIQNFDMKQVFEYVGMAKKLAPILQYVDGNFSSDMNIDSKLNPDMSVDMNSLTGTATFTIPNASVKNFPALKNIAELTKLSQLNNLNLNNVQVKMKIQNGRVVVDPFDVKAGNMNIKVAGSQGIDQTIDYVAGIDVPWAELGAASTVADGLLAKSPIPGITNSLKPEILRFNLNVGGTFMKPIIKMGKPEAVKGSGQSVGSAVTETVKEQFNDLKQQAEDRARHTADSFKRVAEAEAQRRVEQAKQEAAKKIEEEKNKLLNNLKKKLPW